MALRRDWPPGSTAKLRTPDALDKQMETARIGPVALARAVNAGYTHGQRVSHQYLSRLRDPGNRSTRSCSPDLAERIARVLRIDPDLLFVMPGASNPVAHIGHPHAARTGAVVSR